MASFALSVGDSIHRGEHSCLNGHLSTHSYRDLRDCIALHCDHVFSTSLHQLMISIALQRTFVSAGSNAECDIHAGEVYLTQSPGKGLTLDQCKTACQDNADCQSITYYKTGWCSHYSTSCTNTKQKNKAFALRLVDSSGSTVSLDPVQTTSAPKPPSGQFAS